jgi:hypothetical protein
MQTFRAAAPIMERFELHEFIDPLGIPGKGSTYEMSSFEFVRKPDPGLFAE